MQSFSQERRGIREDGAPLVEPAITHRRHVVFSIMAIAGSFLACAMILEIILRLLPVATGLWALPVNASQPIFRFTPNREFLFSRDWNFSIVNRGYINNDGFVNDEDYALHDSRPLLAVIGDSYVEAAMVPNDKTFYRRLAATLKQKGRIYSFGASGAPLSQYLAWTQYVIQKYRPSGVAILVIGNDFDESLRAYNQRPGLHVYDRGPDGRLRLTRTDYYPSPLRSLVRRSALGRYLVFNLGAYDVAKQWAAQVGLISPARAAAPHYVGNTAASASAQRIHDSLEAVDAFFDNMANSVPLPAQNILFLVDGARYRSDIGPTEQSYFGAMRAYFMKQARSRRHEVIDLQPWFIDRNQDGNVRFEFPTDGHWNAIGHEVAAQALASSKIYQTIFDKP